MAQASRKIAIVEDDLAISQMYRMKFEAEGYTVQTADNGKVGFDLIKNFNPDIVLLDLMMPEMNGDELLEKIRKEDWGEDVKVIVLTNLGQEEAPDSLRTLNVHSFIVKAEMTPKQVAEHVKQALA
ncbi:response regulator [Candidatus Saccharibacteria bacterium CPR2]|nr:response regulator [Candidatus Saccharibacteria bacterium CPR2]